MNQKEYLIAGIRRQRRLLADLIGQLHGDQKLDSKDCHLYEVTTKEVEQNLKKLRRFASQELVREIRGNKRVTYGGN